MFDVQFNGTREFWEEFDYEMVELEEKTILNELNKTHNRKGYTISDYENNYSEIY